MFLILKSKVDFVISLLYELEGLSFETCMTSEYLKIFLENLMSKI